MDWKCILLAAAHLVSISSSLDIKSCDRALGMESEEIPDSAVTASSSYVPNVGPKNGRLRLERAGGAWCPKPQVESGVREYLQINLGDVHVVTGIQTQGRYDHGRGQEYVEEYMVEYWRPSLNQWKQYTRWDGKQVEDIIEDIICEAEGPAQYESGSYESSICSEWIVLKPRKKKKKPENRQENSIFDFSELAATRRLLKRPPSPDTEFYDENLKSTEMITSNELKYKDSHPMWPEPPPVYESLMKRPPSPNMSLPRDRVDQEIVGEDWNWIKGKYLLAGEGESFLAAGEDGEYYRVQKKWLEGRWEPSPQLLERWEKEEAEFEKGRREKLEEEEKYNTILKRVDSPGMEIINWGDGPVVMTKWKDFLLDPSVVELSKYIPDVVFEKFLDETSKLSFEIRGLLTSQLKAALMETSSEWLMMILKENVSHELAERIVSEMKTNIHGREFGGEFDLLGGILGEVEFSEGEHEESAASVVSDRWANVVRKPIEVCGDGDIVPRNFRLLLIGFIKQFREDMPDDVLDYALDYFERCQPDKSRKVPLAAKSLSQVSGSSSTSKVNNLRRRRMSIFTHSISETATVALSENIFDKTDEEVEALSKGLGNCFMFHHLGINGFTDIIRNTYRMELSSNEVMVVEGENLNAFYVIESGSFELSSQRHEGFHKILKKYEYFGEFSLIGDAPSPYTIVALEDSVVWGLFGETFRYLSLLDGFQRRNNVNYIMNKKTQIFQKLTHEERLKLLDCTESCTFKRGDVVFCSGVVPEGLYMVLDGTVKLITAGNTSQNPSDLHVSKVRGPSPLNESEFINEEPNESSCIVTSRVAEVALLKFDVFQRLIGDIEDILNRSFKRVVSRRDFMWNYGEGYEFSGEHGVQLDIFSGNSDTATVVTHRLMPPVFASQIRILPYSVHRRTVCLRVELLGCISVDGVVSYSMPKDASWTPGQDLSDITYDGHINENTLEGGLGRLVDGTYGGDNFKMDVGVGKGNGWVGWMNESFPKKYIELVFEFDDLKNFSQVNIFTNNCFSKEVQVFAKARVMFSVGGSMYSGRGVTYSYMPDKVLEHARNVTIHLHHHIAKFIKIQLYFADKWIMISEVTFESEPVDANSTDEVGANLAEEEILIKSGGVHDSAWESYETIAAPTEENGYVEVIIGVLTAVMLLLLGVFVIILVLSRRQKLQGSPTTILRNPFGVTINMKDLLLNLSPMNGSMVQVSAHPTPASADPPSDMSSMCFDQAQHYQTPLVSPYYATTTYASIRSEPKIKRDESAVSEVSQLKDSAATVDDVSDASSLSSSKHLQAGSYSTLQFRSSPLAATTSPVSAVKIGNTANPYAITGPDSPIRKRFHTAPRDKHRMAPPAVSWNIAPSMGHSYKCREGELVPVPRYCLSTAEKMGSCHVGEIFVCEMDGEEVGRGRVVAKTMPGESLREMKLLSSLNDPNVVRTLGVVSGESPPWVVLEFPAELGDLFQLFRTNPNIKYSCLMFMSLQISSGMKYLESKNLVHKDLASRNCLVGRGYSVKISDVAMCNPDYQEHYSAIGGRPPAPIRWLAWESILLDRHTCSSSVWSFAVTLWEILTHCRNVPFNSLTNDEVVHNAELMYYGEELESYLPRPPLCPHDVYEMMIRCWKRDQSLRPTFRELYFFLKRKHLGETGLTNSLKKIDV